MSTGASADTFGIADGCCLPLHSRRMGVTEYKSVSVRIVQLVGSKIQDVKEKTGENIRFGQVATGVPLTGADIGTDNFVFPWLSRRFRRVAD